MPSAFIGGFIRSKTEQRTVLNEGGSFVFIVLSTIVSDIWMYFNCLILKKLSGICFYTLSVNSTYFVEFISNFAL